MRSRAKAQSRKGGRLGVLATLREPFRNGCPRVDASLFIVAFIASSGLCTATADAGDLPLSWDLGGYYRARLVTVHGLPRDVIGKLQDQSARADFGFMRLRLNPALKYGPDPQQPIATLRMQIDGLDNVVFGDNDVIADTPVFGDLPSATDLFGIDVDTLQLKRAWLEFLVPVGQLRIGRMASQWGLGLLANDGNGIKGDFGDALNATTNDRILFATRPLTIANVLSGGDARPTPLITVFAYDKIVEDPHVDVDDPRLLPDEVARSRLPFGNLTASSDDVNQVVAAVVWNDKKFNREFEDDELTAGAYYTYRWQNSSASKVSIIDLFWRWKWSVLGDDGPQLFTEGEVLTIQGTSRAISAGTLTEPSIYGGVIKVGAHDPKWDAVIEVGQASGDSTIGDAEFTGRALNPDYRVGLVMFPIVLNARTANHTPANRPLWSRGGVYNARYLYPHARWRPFAGVEVVGAVLLAWADELSPQLGGVSDASLAPDGRRENFLDTGCRITEGDCLLGIEGDIAVKVHWGDNDLMRWSTELGVMRAGEALDAVIQDDLIWTLQSRIAMVF